MSKTQRAVMVGFGFFVGTIIISTMVFVLLAIAENHLDHIIQAWAGGAAFGIAFGAILGISAYLASSS